MVSLLQKSQNIPSPLTGEGQGGGESPILQALESSPTPSPPPVKGGGKRFARGSGERGFTYIAAMVIVVVMGITLSMAGQYWTTVVKRDREEELLFRGDQIRKGIEIYHKWTAQKHGGKGLYPESLDEMVKSKFSAAPRRSLRQLYKDPVTGKADWVLITDPASKGLMGVRSASNEAPLKSSNFPSAYRGFEGKIKYSDWAFVYGTPAPGQPNK